MNTRCECGCCDGIEALTPSPTRNRPGLPALRYRVGTHATFLETMEARLSSADFPELRGLTTRAADDPAMALLDAWATVADVLTFYQERIVNEGYLRTATERRSVLELARLVGYALRPGVAASVFLAFTMEQNHQATIPAGARSQSLPGPGELPQSFETSDDLDARAEWNTLRPRLTRPAQLTLTKPAGGGASINAKVLYFQGVATGLKAGDRLLFVFGDKSGDAIVRHVAQVEAQAADSRTKITLQEIPTLVPLETPASGRTEVKVAPQINAISTLGLLREPLARAPALHPANQFRLNRDIRQTLGASGDLIPQLLGVVDPSLQTTIYQAWGHATVTVSAPVSIYALRATAALFGHNVLPPKPPDPQINRVAPHHALAVAAAGETADWSPADDEASDTLFLDNAYDQVLTGSHIVVQRPDQADPQIFLDVTAAERPRTAYGITANTTKITLEGSSWWQPRIQGNTPADPSTPFTAVRGTVVYAQSDLLALADQPIDPIDEPVTGSDVELSGVFGGLRAGRWLIVVGERTDILDGQGLVVPGIRGAELVMLGGVTHDAGTIPGDTIHTTVSFSHDLAYTYKLDTVAIYGNVVNATHGETRNEVLGSGNPAMVRQQFALRQSPLTFVSSPTPAGCSSTLDVRVDGILWHEVDSVGELSAQSRGFITRTDDDNQTTVIFGDGKRGARPPSGVENIKGTYRNWNRRSRQRQGRADHAPRHAAARAQEGHQPDCRVGRRRSRDPGLGARQRAARSDGARPSGVGDRLRVLLADVCRDCQGKRGQAGRSGPGNGARHDCRGQRRADRAALGSLHQSQPGAAPVRRCCAPGAGRHARAGAARHQREGAAWTQTTSGSWSSPSCARRCSRRSASNVGRSARACS